MFKTVVVDPPWKKSTGGVGHASLQPSTHYDVQTRGEIIQTVDMWMNHYGVAPEAHMYMWTVNSFTAGLIKEYCRQFMCAKNQALSQLV